MQTAARNESRSPRALSWIVFTGLLILFGRIIPALF